MEDFLGIYGHLGLFEAHHVVIRWPPDTSSFFVSGLKTRGALLFFVHEEYLGAVDMTCTWGPYPLGLLPLTSLCDLPLLFVYFQVNNGVVHFLDYYVEDILCTSWSSLSSFQSITQIICIYHFYMAWAVQTRR